MSRYLVFLAACAIFALNALIIGRWFNIEWLDRLPSIEGTFIGLARYIAENPSASAWFPYWYNGVPFENTYPPLLNYCTAAVVIVSDFTAARAYHLATGFFYCLAPTSLFLLLVRLGARLVPAVAAALAASLLFPSIWLLPLAHADSQSLWDLRRFYILASYGAGPQISALALLPISAVALDAALKRPNWSSIPVASAALTLCPLTNWIGAFAAACAVASLIATHVADGRRLTTLVTAACCVLWSYLLVIHWLPPETIADALRNAQISGQAYPMDTGRYLGLITILLCGPTAAFFLRKRWRVSPAAAFLAGLAVPMTALPLIEQRCGIYLIPQPHRYQVELDFTLAALLGLSAGVLLPKLMKRSALAA